MNPQTEVKPNQKPAADVIEHRAIKVLILEKASRFNNSARIATARGITITPARFAGADWVACTGDQQPTGFGLSQRVVDHSRGQTFIKRGFIPMSAVREVVFG